MKTCTVNISLPEGLMTSIDATAKAELRSRSELIREATRLYVERRNRWQQLFRLAERQGERRRLQPRDIETAIAQYRRNPRRHA